MICISLMTKDVEHLFNCFSAIMFLLLRILCLRLYSIFNWAVFLIYSFLSYLPILDISVECVVDKSLSCSIRCCFVQMIVSLQKVFSFMKSHLLIIDHNVHTYTVLLREAFPVPMSTRLFHTFSSIRFSVSGDMLRSLIHLDLNFVQGN